MTRIEYNPKMYFHTKENFKQSYRKYMYKTQGGVKNQRF